MIPTIDDIKMKLHEWVTLADWLKDNSTHQNQKEMLKDAIKEVEKGIGILLLMQEYGEDHNIVTNKEKRDY